jgi:mono/diheme cytochrome c family protein
MLRAAILSVCACLACWFCECAAAAAAEPAPTSAVRFNRDIRPILSDNCFACHGPDEDDRGGDLRLDVREDAVADRGGYAAIVPGKPDESEILRRILSHDADEVMPPPRAKKTPLTASQIETLRRWIAEGAPYQRHWAFEPIDLLDPPDVAGLKWSRNPIDAFIAARLYSEGLTPSPDADKEVLLRRVSLDLVGLQPTPDQLATFLADNSPDAYERAVDRLLASPHYGERWGRHWLDQARYADSNGYSVDSGRTMWPYRDWVIDAVNRDMPFDQFTIHQLAGDLLPDATKLQRIASGFQRNTMINEEGGSKPEQFRVEAAIDRVNTTGAVWLGLTVGCAQCHSHKYDPISHKEYFQLFAFYDSDADVNNVADTVEVVPGEIIGNPGAVTRQQLDQADRDVARTRAAARDRLGDWIASWPSIEVEAAPGPSNVWTAVASEVSTSGTSKMSLPLTPSPSPIVALRLTFPAEKPEGEDTARRSHAKDDTFVVSEVTVSAGGKPVPLMTAFASMERPKFSATESIDGNAATGWSVDPKDPLSDAALLVVPREPIPAGTPLVLSVTFPAGKQDDKQVPRRLSVETTSDPTLAPLDAATVATLIDAIKASRSQGEGPKDADLLKAFAVVDVDQHAAAFDREQLRRKATIGKTLVMRHLAKPRETLLHIRGDYLNPDKKLGPLVPGTPAFLPPLEPAANTAGGTPTAAPNRLALARWLVRADNPLTPRVTVNRVWMRYFGTGLVETENDFGTQGSAPSHPELLDWLAATFVKDGWSMKKLHQLIVTSATYRQSSVHRADLAAKDPRNLLLGRQNRIRLDAEIIRDTALLAAGLLCDDMGGPPVHPPQPDGVYSFTQTGKTWRTDTGPQRYRRSLYTQFYRSAPHPLFTTFDAPNFSTVCTRRSPSNTPLQSLMLANDPIFVEAANAIGDRVVAAVGGDGGTGGDSTARAIDRLFRFCLARPPSAMERRLSEDFLLQQRGRDQAASSDAWRHQHRQFHDAGVEASCRPTARSKPSS